jgi:hypothetical protein
MAFWGADHGTSTQIKDPKRKFRFMVQMTGFGDTAVDNTTNGGNSGEIWFAKSANKPSFTINAAEHKYLNHTFYYPGAVTWNEVTVTMVDPQDPDVAGTLSELVEKMGYIVPDNLNDRSTISKWSAASNIGKVYITQLDAEGRELEKWTLYNAFITEVTYGDLAYGDDELTEMTVKFKYDWSKLTVSQNTTGASISNSYFD